jgi:hypothetical protein
MTNESDEETNWTRRTLLEMGASPAIRGAMLDGTEREPGTLKKVK